ncbi:MAG: beta-galactosidase [Limnochordia bacterium]
MGDFKVVGDHFVVDGEQIQIISGAIHYFRVVPEYWKDRLLKMKACGFNTVETYVSWNLHEPQPGQFCFEGGLDIEQFVKEAGEIGLYVIVRPGPYICAEWEFGGLPAWLLADPKMRVRCKYEPYLKAVDRFFDALLPRLVPLQYSQGGPIIAMQVENEYGSFGNDAGYLRYLKDGMRARGVDVLLFTSDGPSDAMLQGGTLPDVLKIANFGSRTEEAFRKLREYQPEGPLMCGEFWNGWFDHWGEEHKTRSAEDAAQELDTMLGMGASVNVFMFHGGTNFGFLNGANHGNGYEPTITSYDYDAPLSEAGDLTPKYWAFREVIGKYTELPKIEFPEVAPKLALGEVRLEESVGLFPSLNRLSEPVSSTVPLPMEEVGQNYGFILYRTHVTGPRPRMDVIVQELRDRAQVFLNGASVGTLERWNKEKKLSVAIPKEGARLDLLVENMGRVNYGRYLLDRKGITEGVLLGYQFLFDWTMFPLPLDDLCRLSFNQGICQGGPAFYRGHFSVDEPKDTFLALDGWTKGVCFINGFNLGRYWNRGPQRTLYVPGPILKKGTNEVIVFELHGMEAPVVEFRDQPDLG